MSKAGLQPGRGVQRLSSNKREVEPPPEEEVGGLPVWQPKPSMADQYEKLPHTVRMGPPVYDIFDLNRDGELERMNKFVARTHPRGAPEIIVTSEQRKFHCASWKILVSYQVLEYLKITPAKAASK